MVTIQQLYTNTLNELSIQLGIDNPDQTLQAIAMMQAGSWWLHFKAQGEIQKNFSPETAYSEVYGGTLEIFGRYVLGRNPNPATQGEYTVTVTGAIGGFIEEGKTLRNDNNDLYTVQSDVTLTGTIGEVSVISQSAGTEFELAPDIILYFTSPIPDVNSEAVVKTVDVSPIAAETEEEYKTLIIQAEQIEAQGGSAADYRLWSSDANGVVNSYYYATNEPSIINGYIEANTPNGVPTQTILDDVKDVVEFNPDTTLENRGRRPLSAWLINYLPVAPINVDIEITNLKDETAISTVETAVIDYLKTVRPIVDGADDPNEKNDILSLANINTVINNSLAQGNTYDQIVLKVDNNVISTYQFTFGSIPYLNSITSV